MSFENQIKEILKARLEGTATEEELAILREWLDRSPQNRELAELLEESAENLPLLGRIYGYDEQRVWGNIRKAARRRRMRMLAATARKYAAVAAVAALLAGGGWWTLGRRAERLARQAYIEQLTPGVRGAVLTLSSGENVALEAGGRRMLVEQDGTRLEIAGEELAYHKVEAEQEIPMTNTVTVPRGKEFSLRLSDGTQVWLNSESSLVFPVRFGDGPREVTVTGEAYFDVAHDEAHPFVVKTENLSVRVLGTAFNVRAHAADPLTEVVLERGSVRLQTPEGYNLVRLHPNQRAVFDAAKDDIEVEEIYAEHFVTERYNLVAMKNATIGEIIARIESNYGVRIRIADPDNRKRYDINYLRTNSLEEVIDIVEFMTGQRCEVVRGK